MLLAHGLLLTRYMVDSDCGCASARAGLFYSRTYDRMHWPDTKRTLSLMIDFFIDRRHTSIDN